VVDVAELLGDECYGGLDLATTRDLNSLCLLFPPRPATDTKPARRKWVALWWFWCPLDTAKARGERDKVPYEQWGKEGFVHLTPGNVTDYDAIRKDIAGTYIVAGENERGQVLHDTDCIADKFRIVEIAYDRWNASQLVNQLAGDGVTMVPLGQGFQSLSSPMKGIERIVLNKTLVHNANPVARWNCSNLAAATDPAGNIKPDKEKSTERIDGMAALVDAMARAMTRDVDDGGYRPSIFDNGPVVIT